MVSITKKGKSFQVRIKYKNSHEYKTFADYETAHAYGVYRENLLKEKEAFNIPKKDMYTLEDILHLKYENAKKELSDVINFCEPLLHRTVKEITYNEFKELALKMLKKPIRRGGTGKGGGQLKMPEKRTIIKKMSMISTAINNIIKEGIDVNNEPYKVVKFLRELKDD